tara:strand:- start:72 stop:470 length:399 start_codon:yes stop_codon:yes gene_type:complete
MTNDNTYGSKRRMRPISQRENLPLQVFTSSISAAYEGGVLPAVADKSYYIWAFAACTGTDAAFAGKVCKDHDDDDRILQFVCSKQGPFYQELPMPIEVGVNRAISIHNFGANFPASTANLISIYYTLLDEND